MQIKLSKQRQGIKWKSLQKAHIKRPAQEKIDFDFYQNSDGDESSAESKDRDDDMDPGQGILSLSLYLPLSLSLSSFELKAPYKNAMRHAHFICPVCSRL